MANKVVLGDPSEFIDAIKNISGLLSETNITLKQDCLEIASMDPANVALVVFKMKASCFSEYEVSEENSYGVKLNDFKTILARGPTKSSLTLEFSDKAKISFVGTSRKSFEMKLVEVENKLKKIPQLTPNAVIEVELLELKDAIGDASIAGEAAKFEVVKDQFFISGQGDLNKAISEVKAGISKLNDKAACSKYSIEYLNKMTSTKLSKVVLVKLGEDYPVTLEYSNKDKSITLMYVCAPRVDNN